MNNFFLFFSYSRSAIAITSTVPWPIKDTTTNASQIQETKCIDRSKWAIQEKKRRKRKKKINKKKEEITCFICRGQSYGSLSLSLSLSLCVNVLSYVVRFRRHRRDRRYRLILRGVQLRRRGRRKACVAQERGFQPKKGRSAPHIPPVVSAGLGATEPLRGSTIRRAQWCSTDLRPSLKPATLKFHGLHAIMNEKRKKKEEEEEKEVEKEGREEQQSLCVAKW